MSFLERLGMRSVSKVEHSHGDPEVLTLHNLIIPIDVTAAAHSEQSAVDKLVYDGNIFTSTSVIVTKGYIAEVNKSNLLVFNLRHIATSKVVAQICVDVELSFKAKITRKRDVAYFPEGEYPISPDTDGEYLAEYYFLTILN